MGTLKCTETQALIHLRKRSNSDRIYHCFLFEVSRMEKLAMLS